MKKNLRLLFSAFLLFMLSISAVLAQNKYTVSGRIKDAATGEVLIGAAVVVPSLGTGVVTNEYGFYSLTIPQGNYTLIFRYIGFQEVKKEVILNKDVSLNIELGESAKTMDEAVVSAKAQDQKVENKQISVVKLDIETIKQIPVVFGEVDILKTVTFMPGIQQAGEGSTGILVRGGSQDQNLILLDEATVYNAAHLLGFFSVFNGDAIRDLDVYKGGIPAKYGGRLSSLLDIRMRDGNSKRYTATGGIGTISSRLTLEGPIVKEKSSFMIAGRRSYADIFLPLAPNEAAQQSRLYFYDLNLKANYQISDKDRLYLSGYFGRDVFGFAELFGVDWGNATATLRWNHLFNQKLFSNLTFIYSDFNYGTEFKFAESGNFGTRQGIQDWSLKGDLTYYFNPNSRLYFGGQSIYHTFNPGTTESLNEATRQATQLDKLQLPFRDGLENAIYVDHDWKISERFNMRYGLRFSSFSNIGATEEYRYGRDEFGKPIPVDTLVFGKNEFYNTYGGLEPRFSMSYNIAKETAIKISYNRTYQYIQQASNAASTLPTDQWIPSNLNIKPQIADQIAGGYFRNFGKGWETSAEVYYKWMQNQIDYRDNASLFFNPQIDGELLFGRGWAYGLELFLSKTQGKFTGFMSYTLSKTKRQIEGINNGQPYDGNFDRPHSLNTVFSYQLNKRVLFSGTFVFQSGRPTTVPIGKFYYDGRVTPVYGERNNYRIPDYHRADLGVTINAKKKEDKRFESSWNFSVYNFYARENPFALNFREVFETDPETGERVSTGQTEAVQIALFKIIPSVTWNFKF